MLHILQQALAAVLPEPASVTACARAPHEAIDRCYRPHLTRDGTTMALTEYREPLVRDAVTANKFYAHDRAAALLARLLIRHLGETYQSPQDHICIVPVPLHSQRERARGHNQVTTVAQAATTGVPVWVYPKALRRTRATVAQTQLSARARTTNLRDAFAVSNIAPLLRARHVILLDDVYTTGATMNAARATLTPHLPKETNLICVALAHSGA